MNSFRNNIMYFAASSNPALQGTLLDKALYSAPELERYA